MGQAISDVLPLAVGVMISPIPIMGVILMLFSPRARVNGPSFLLGWVVGLGAVCAVVYAVATGLDTATDPDASDASSTLLVVLGVVLVLMARRQWRSRPKAGAQPPLPKWMAAVDEVTPVKAIGLGLLLSAVNPKNLLLSVGAAAAVGQTAGLSTTDAEIALAVFVIIGSLSVGVPVIAYLFAGDRMKPSLESWKLWLEHNNATVMAVLLLVIGVVLLSKGLGPLTT
ncbi:MAG: GAP family protein [Acidimicrobiia bacterium]